jgi:hypothetical protein
MAGNVARMRENNSEYSLLDMRLKGRRICEITKLKYCSNVKIGRNIV